MTTTLLCPMPTRQTSITLVEYKPSAIREQYRSMGLGNFHVLRSLNRSKMVLATLLQRCKYESLPHE